MGPHVSAASKLWSSTFLQGNPVCSRVLRAQSNGPEGFSVQKEGRWETGGGAEGGEPKVQVIILGAPQNWDPLPASAFLKGHHTQLS